MVDREKVIKGLNCCAHTDGSDCTCCPYEPYDNVDEDCTALISMDVLALLNKQESKWVEDKQDKHCRLIKCAKCGLTFIVGNNISYDEWIEDRNYCRRCGARMVKQ